MSDESFATRYVNLADPRLGAAAIFATDEFFAPKERLLDPAPAQFIPGKYDDHGKWMDGWESRRKRVEGHDHCIVRLALPGVVLEAGAPVTIVAHSAGVLTTVHWARKHDLPVRGALLATPPDLARPLPAEYPSLEELDESGWLPIPRNRLRFPSILAASTNDALGDVDNVRGLADAWGSRFIDIGPVGHLNPASGYGEWPGAEALLDVLGGMLRTPSAAATASHAG